MTDTKTFLVVDDNPKIKVYFLQVFDEEIYQNKYQMFFAENGVEALKILKEEPEIKLIITDLKMKEMDGFELLERIKNKEIKKVVISAYPNPQNMRHAFLAGSCDFLTKPFDKKDIHKTVTKILEELPPEIRKPRSVKKLLKELPTEQVKDAMITLIERIHSRDIEEIKQQLAAQEILAQENEKEYEEQLYAYEQNGETGIHPEKYEKGFVERRMIKRPLADGTLKEYGPYYYLRWKEGNKLRTKFIRKDDPRVKKLEAQHISRLTGTPKIKAEELFRE